MYHYRKILVLYFLWLNCSTIYAVEQTALVIGNSQYHVGYLRHSVNNAIDVAEILKDKNFEVVLKTNLKRREMEQIIREFKERLDIYKGIGLFYFSGYSKQVEGKNYLLPIDNIHIKDEIDIKYGTIPLDKILEKIQKTGNESNIIILDTSPEIPYLDSRYQNNSKEGLANIEILPDNTIIGYATEPGSTTYFPKLYTKHLMSSMLTGIRIDDVFMRIRRDVKWESHGKQIPNYQSSLRQIFCLSECQTIKSPPPFFIAYATSPNEEAYDSIGGERNSPYTKNILKFISQSNLPIELLFKKVRDSVTQETVGGQTPVYDSSLEEVFYFAGKKKDKTVRRIALVIGNAAYQRHLLGTSLNDAEDMSRSLKKLGFEVTHRINTDKTTMQRLISNFGQKLDRKTIGLFYFSGKGGQYNGKDYLWPISGLDHIAVNKVVNTMQQTDNVMNIIIIDASRSSNYN